MTTGYRFVPLPPQVHRAKRPHAVFHRIPPDTMWVVLEVELVALERVHIGSGFRTLRGQRAVRAAARSGDRLVIPGSTMKGLLRARYEAITRSCAPHREPKNQQLGDQLPSRSFPGYKVELAASVRQHSVFAECAPQHSCSACALFGRMSQRSRVSVHDLIAPASASTVDATIPKRYSPRLHHLGRFAEAERDRRLTVQELHGRKLYTGDAPPPEVRGEIAEVVRPGTRFSGRITCTNISMAELGGLLSALGAQPVSTIKIGSAKAYGFGRLGLFKNVGIEVTKPESFDGTDFFAKVRREFETSQDYWDAGERTLVTMHGETGS